MIEVRYVVIRKPGEETQHFQRAYALNGHGHTLVVSHLDEHDNEKWTVVTTPYAIKFVTDEQRVISGREKLGGMH